MEGELPSFVLKVKHETKVKSMNMKKAILHLMDVLDAAIFQLPGSLAGSFKVINTVCQINRTRRDHNNNERRLLTKF